MKKYLKLLKSKTVWAGIVAAATQLVNADPITGVDVLQAGSLLLAAIGVKDAITKTGEKK